MFRDGELVQLTHDHSRAQQLANLGIIAEDAVATHPLRNTLTNCLGKDHRVEVDFLRFRLKDADGLLLCTDGLSDMVDPADIEAILANADDSATACRALVSQALQRGGKDNVTVLFARYAIPTATDRA